MHTYHSTKIFPTHDILYRLNYVSTYPHIRIYIDISVHKHINIPITALRSFPPVTFSKASTIIECSKELLFSASFPPYYHNNNYRHSIDNNKGDQNFMTKMTEIKINMNVHTFNTTPFPDRIARAAI